MLVGPDSVLVAARLDMDDDLGRGRAWRTPPTGSPPDCCRNAIPEVVEVYLDVTSGPAVRSR